MRVAFFHELRSGGARRVTNEFARQLIKRGHVVDLYTIGVKKNDEKNFYKNIYNYRFVPKKWNGHNWKARLYKDSVELIKLYFLDKKIAKDISKRKYDFAYIAASDFIESPFILNFLKIPKFFYCNDPYYRMVYEKELFNKKGVNGYKIFYENINKFIRKYLDKWNVKQADFIIAVSKYTNNSFKNVYKRKADVVYPGVDASYFTPKRIKKDIDVLYVGSREFLDGYALFKKTLREVKSEIKVKEVLVEEEWLNDEQLLALYRRSKILAATAFREPLGLVPLEAMSCGVVVVAVDDGAHRETVVDKVTGFVLKKNPKEIGNKIDWLLNNPKMLKGMSCNARDLTAKNWNWEKRGGELEDLLLRKII